MKNIYRHGDVSLHEVDKLPEGLKKVETLTLAYGEATGHHHSFVTDRPETLEIFEDEKGNKWMNVKVKSNLTHQEHKTLEIQKGFYQIRIEQEFSPFDEEISRVRD